MNGETIQVGRVVTAVKLARKLVREVEGNLTLAHALIEGEGSE
jgi:hypothetical protein